MKENEIREVMSSLKDDKNITVDKMTLMGEGSLRPHATVVLKGEPSGQKFELPIAVEPARESDPRRHSRRHPAEKALEDLYRDFRDAFSKSRNSVADACYGYVCDEMRKMMADIGLTDEL